MLEKAGQTHLIPYRSPRQFLAHKTGKATQEEVLNMASLKHQKYGLTVFEGFKRPYKQVSSDLKNQYLNDTRHGKIVQKPIHAKRASSYIGMHTSSVNFTSDKSKKSLETI